ncbi:MAG: family 20 glycosylhydrolase [Spirochaetales bacterium]|nr:family 20 glycosylhydrolase [Spirochaetales bacterium]
MNILPKPLVYKKIEGYTVLDKTLCLEINSSILEFNKKYLIEELYKQPNINFIENGDCKVKISLILKEDFTNTEEYRLEIFNNLIKIESGDISGIFYGIQTFLQYIYNKNEIDNCVIEDKPRFNWRGTMLDVSRHFFSVSDVKRYIDLISFYKFNKLHLHLSDDQGWRIEIDSWPELVNIGSKSEVGSGSGGYYTKKDYIEIVEYASLRNITIIPEIDMPGHVNAILASYPQLNIEGQIAEIYRGTKVGFSSLDTDNELTYTFINDVIKEISELTPGKYIHIGGDEAKKTDFPKYKKFIERVQKIVKSHNKIMIGWEECAKTALESDSIVQIWTPESDKCGIHNILSPAKHIYFDIKYNETIGLGHDWAGYTDLKKAYNWDPETVYPFVDINSVIGIESPIWTEFITNINEIEFMSFPRLIGVAEKAWSQDSRDFDDYLNRLKKHLDYLRYKKINFYECEYLK